MITVVWIYKRLEISRWKLYGQTQSDVKLWFQSSNKTRLSPNATLYSKNRKPMEAWCVTIAVSFLNHLPQLLIAQNLTQLLRNPLQIWKGNSSLLPMYDITETDMSLHTSSSLNLGHHHALTNLKTTKFELNLSLHISILLPNQALSNSRTWHIRSWSPQLWSSNTKQHIELICRLTVSSMSNKRNALLISSLDSRSPILAVIIFTNSSNSITPLPSSSILSSIFLMSCDMRDEGLDQRCKSQHSIHCTHFACTQGRGALTDSYKLPVNFFQGPTPCNRTSWMNRIDRVTHD